MDVQSMYNKFTGSLLHICIESSPIWNNGAMAGKRSTPASKHCSNGPSAENHGTLRTSYTELLEKPYFARIGRAHATQFVRETRARSVWRPRDSRGLVRRSRKCPATRTFAGGDTWTASTAVLVTFHASSARPLLISLFPLLLASSFVRRESLRLSVCVVVQPTSAAFGSDEGTFLILLRRKNRKDYFVPSDPIDRVLPRFNPPGLFRVSLISKG
eukprot:scaffold785_cov335-Pavlova_lutheri.AAC.8